jgi:hypothetical protein
MSRGVSARTEMGTRGEEDIFPIRQVVEADPRADEQRRGSVRVREKRALPTSVSPMLATLTGKPFFADRWLFEPKPGGWTVSSFAATAACSFSRGTSWGVAGKQLTHLLHAISARFQASGHRTPILFAFGDRVAGRYAPIEFSGIESGLTRTNQLTHADSRAERADAPRSQRRPTICGLMHNG